MNHEFHGIKKGVFRMKEILVKLYSFNELSETSKQKALKMLEKPFLEIGETETLRECIDDVLFYVDGTIA